MATPGRRRFAVGFAVLAALLAFGAAALWTIGRGALGERQHAGEVTRTPRPASDTAGRATSQRAALSGLGAAAPKQILFGDLHVHTTFSSDAYMLSLPMYGGEGAHPPADACDFARFCSGLDFWSINDHAEGLSPAHWDETRETIRQCNAVAGTGDAPDLVSFLGWEWTQIGATPEDHYGHKNVLLRDTADDAVPLRPISSRPELFPRSSGARPLSPWLRALFIVGKPGSETAQPYHDLALFMQDQQDLVACDSNAPVRELPRDCHEAAETPTELFARLDEWGFPHMVIPHGNAWGIYTPPGSSWDRQLARNPDPERTEPLVEVFSGHGNVEEHRPWRSVKFEGDTLSCPEPSVGYLPECWQAGEIIRARCLESGAGAGECDARAATARTHYVDAGLAGRLTVPGTTAEDWLDAGQCTDCFMPAYRYRPGGSSQYALAITNFDDPARPKRFRFGFIASSDVHSARPGIGYKEVERPFMTDTRLSLMGPPRELLDAEPAAESVPLESLAMAVPDFERSGPFFGAGGLVAVHAESRDREAIWSALERREVYGTSGPRILLHFDWLGEDAEQPMGSEIRTASPPRFRVRAVGERRQLPGCPDASEQALGADRLARLCRGECFHPGDAREPIVRIEVVRVRPQIRPGEPVAPLIEDPWRVLPCPADGAGCEVEFADEDFAASARDATYYVRAIQAATPTINGAGLRCTRSADGRCETVDLCYGDERTPEDEDCLADAEERAWSSPIFLLHGGGA